MADQAPSSKSDRVPPSLELIKTVPDERPGSQDLLHCAYRMKGHDSNGVFRDYSAVCGPIGCPLPADLGARTTSRDTKGDITEPKLPNVAPDMHWDVNAGYVLLWGWWPVATTPTVRIGTEGRGIALVIEDAPNAREIIINLGVDSTRIQDKNNARSVRVLSKANEFVEIIRDSKGVVTIGPSAIIRPGSILDEFVADVLVWKSLVEP